MAGMWIKRSSWSSIKNMWIRTQTGWSPVRSGHIKRSTGWSRFWFKANVPNELTKPRFNTTNTGAGTIYDGPTATSPQYLDADLFGKDGTYSNYTSILDRRMSYGDTLTADINSRTTVGTDDRFTSAGGVTNTNRLAVDEKYLFYEMTVANGTDVVNRITSISNGIKMIKRQPALGAFTTAISGQANPGVVLTFSYNLENYYYNRLEQANSKIKWWRSNDTTASGTLLKEEVLTDTVTSSNSSSLSGSSTYTIHASDDNDKYIVVEIVGESSWTRNAGYTSTSPYQVVKRSVGPVNSPYRFTFGKHFYVSSNGHIGLASGSTSFTSMSSGRNISVFVKDLEQYYLAEYSNEDVYHLYFKSYLLNSAASSTNALDYQIKFYKDPAINYCDIYIVRKGSNVGSTSDIAPGYYESGTTGYAGMTGPYAISQGTVFRVYFGGTAGTTSGISWTAINEDLWDPIQTWNYPDGGDDIFTDVTSATNQSAPIPTTPTALSTSINASNQIVLTYSGGTGNQYDIYYNNSDTRPTDQQAYSDFPGETSPYIATTITGRGTTRWFWVRKSTGTLRSNWFPAGSGITARLPLFAPPAPVITNSAQAQTTLSWHWTKPTPDATQDQPTSWDYALTTSTTSPTSGWTNVTTLPTAAAPIVISSLTSGTDYYLHVKAKNDDSSTLATPVLGRTTSNKVAPTIGTPTLSATGAFVIGQRRLSVPYTAVSGSGPAYQIYWYYDSTKPSVSVTPDGSGTTSPILDESGPTSIGRCYIYIRSSATTSTTGTTAPSTTLSDWSDGVSIDISGTRTLTYDDNTTDTTASMPTSPVSGTDPWDGWVTTVSASTPTRTGYTFNGWNTTSSGNGTDYASSAAITLTSNVTLYAKWTANTYTITYDANGSTSGTVPSDQTKTYGTNLTLRTNSGSLAKTDFSFGGWNTNAAGTGTSYASGGTYSTNAGATLYARWIVPFVTPNWTGTMPAWAASSPFVNGNNFRRNASSLQYGWNNGTFTWSGSTRGTAAADRGWDFYVSETAPASTTATRTPTNTFQYSTTTSGTQIGTTSFIYRINPTYTTNSVYGSIRPYQFGTDNNKYVRGTQPNGTWSGSI